MSTPHVIAIIDDHSALREALVDLLRSDGYATEAYASGEAFLKRMTAANVACVVSDIRMPGISGVDMQARLHSIGFKAPIIFMTWYFDDRTRGAAMDGGAFGFVTKPVDDAVLL